MNLYYFKDYDKKNIVEIQEIQFDGEGKLIITEAVQALMNAGILRNVGSVWCEKWEEVTDYDYTNMDRQPILGNLESKYILIKLNKYGSIYSVNTYGGGVLRALENGNIQPFLDYADKWLKSPQYSYSLLQDIDEVLYKKVEDTEIIDGWSDYVKSVVQTRYDTFMAEFKKELKEYNPALYNKMYGVAEPVECEPVPQLFVTSINYPAINEYYNIGWWRKLFSREAKDKKNWGQE